MCREKSGKTYFKMLMVVISEHWDYGDFLVFSFFCLFTYICFTLWSKNLVLMQLKFIKTLLTYMYHMLNVSIL